MRVIRSVGQVVGLLLLVAGAVSASEWVFRFDGPLPRWKDGVPVGNGRTGAQVWGTGEQLYLTLDRSDVWDLRYEENRRPTFNYKRLRELVKARDHAAIQTEMMPDVSPLSRLAPTKISIGRLRVTLPPGTRVQWAELDMRMAEARWGMEVFGKPVRYRVLAAVEPDVILATIEGVDGWMPQVKLEALGDLNAKLTKDLGYPKPVEGGEGDLRWVTQSLVSGGDVSTTWTSWTDGGRWFMLATVGPAKDRRSIQEARRRGVERLIVDHREWWQRRWARSSVDIPEAGFDRLWKNGIYKLASSSYKGAPANLQGLWPPDGEIPPWRGEYALNMNVQQTYWPAYSSNQLDLAEPLERWLFEVAPASELLTRRFFGVDGLWMATAVDGKGRPLGGHMWMPVQWWLGAPAWMAQHVWWHWSYSHDKEWLRARGYPFLKKVTQFFENILEEGPDGKLHVPLSASPEYYSNDLEAWTADPTCDLSLVRNLLRYTEQAAAALAVDETKREQWRKMEARLAAYPVGRGGLKVQPDSDYARSHRHPMQLFPIFPGEDLTVEGADADRKLIAQSIQEWVRKGTGEWTGWSYPYGALIAARVRRGNHALQMLKAYQTAYIWPNGFHVNGDYKRYGYSFYDYEPFTMEAECGFTAAVNELLMQSWGGRLRIFPAVPETWRNVRFQNLRAEGGVLVSAEMREGEVVSATVESPEGGEVKVVWPLGRVAPGAPHEVRTLKLSAGDRKELVGMPHPAP